MTIEQVNELHSGDQVFWTDPDDGICSKYITISNIEIREDMVCLTGKDGSYLEAFPGELSNGSIRTVEMTGFTVEQS